MENFFNPPNGIWRWLEFLFIDKVIFTKETGYDLVVVPRVRYIKYTFAKRSRGVKLQGALIILNEAIDSLPGAEKRVANFILQNPGKAIMLNITQLAEASGSNVAGVVRLCRRLGMKGFRDLKLRLTWDVSQQEEPKKLLSIGPGFTIDRISHSVVNASIETIKRILDMLDEQAMEESATTILRAKRVDLYGVGASGIVAQDLLQKLLRIGMICFYNSDSHLQLTSACALKPGDASLAISYSGKSRSIVLAAEEARKSGASTISITRFGANPLSEVCEINLFVPSTEPLFREGAMASRIAQLVVVDILFSIIVSRRFEEVQEKLTHSMDILNQMKL